MAAGLAAGPASRQVTTAIVIPVFNGMPQLEACLRSLRWTDREGVRVVVVDAGSRDGSVDATRRVLPGAMVVDGHPGMWWTASVQEGCRFAVNELGAARLCLLNHDCRWSRQSYRALSACLDRRPGHIVCSRVTRADDGELLSAGGRVLHSGMLWLRGQEGCIRDARKEGPVAWCGGQGVLFSAQVFARTGGFDALRFPHYFGDADFCLRARRLGITVWYCPESEVVVDTSTTGIAPPREGAHLRDLWMSLVSRKSVSNIRDNVRFYGRHMRWLAVPALGHVYARWAAIAAVRWARSLRRCRP